MKFKKYKYNIKYFLIPLLAFNLISCSKAPGPGGNSSIRGKVLGSNFTQGEIEHSQISFPLGSEIEHGDYWTFNSANNQSKFYVFYKHPSWITDPDPQLEGRIGIQVVFDYNQNNVEIAQNTFDALQLSNLSEVTFTLNNDILSIENNGMGFAMDADNGTSNVQVDILNQGKPSSTDDMVHLGEQRVYLVYGDNAFYSNDTRTNASGEFSFDGYNKGLYRVYVLSKDTLSNETVEISKTIEIQENKTIYTIENFQIIH